MYQRASARTDARVARGRRQGVRGEEAGLSRRLVVGLQAIAWTSLSTAALAQNGGPPPNPCDPGGGTHIIQSSGFTMSSTGVMPSQPDISLPRPCGVPNLRLG